VNTIFFHAKRLFLSSVAVTRKNLRAIHPGMTAARYDLLYAIQGSPTKLRHFLATRTRTQSKVRRQLGVAAPVVSRMVRSLVKLGWVEQWRPWDGDTRQRKLRITPEGRTHFVAAFQKVARFARRLVYRALRGDRHWKDAPQWLVMSEMESRLHPLLRAFKNRAKLWYWYPSPDDD
jgi:DNA-binding MarR family transcriptional regulator